MSGVIDLHLEGDGALADWAELGFDIRHFTVEHNEVRMTYLSSGMGSGRPSIGLAILDPIDKEVIFLEMSHDMLQTVAAGCRAKAELEGFWP